MNELVAHPPRISKVGGRISQTDLQRKQEPKIGESSRSFIRPQVDELAARQYRRWEGSGKHKARGSLLSRREGGDFIPHQPRAQGVKATSKPKIQKAKKSLRVNPDINIPSTVSVGNFARLLNVSLSEDFESPGRGYR